MIVLINHMKRYLFSSLLIGVLFLLQMPSIVKSLPIGSVIDQPGSFISPEGGYDALLEISGMGGFLALTVVSKSDGRRSDVIGDVSGIGWVSENQLLYIVTVLSG